MIVLSGYFGYDNLGDEAILAALIEQLHQIGIADSHIVVLSANPTKTRSLYGVEAIPRYDLAQIIKTLRRARLLISGGGSLLQDVTSKRTIPYYLGVVELANLLGVPVVMYAQGLGPIANQLLRKWTTRAFRRAHGFTVRDELSGAFLQELGLSVSAKQITGDPVFALNCPSFPKQDSRELVINLRPYPQWEQDKLAWVSLWQEISKEYRLRFVPLGPGDSQIGAYLQDALPKMRVLSLTTYQQVLAFLAQHSVGVFMRLHGMIFAALADCYPLGLAYDPKITAIGEQLQTPVLPARPGGELRETILRLRGERAGNVGKLKQQVDLLRARTQVNKSLVESALVGKS